MSGHPTVEVISHRPADEATAAGAAWPASRRCHRGIHPDRAMAAHPVGAETRSSFCRAEGITIKLVIRGTSTGFADAR
jgi:hypothetical protein